MFTANRQANAYATVGIETGIAAASPHKLILMLFEGAMVSLVEAQKHLQDKNVGGKIRSISKAIQIIEEGLKASLDDKVGGAIALRLRDLYDYMGRRLLMANLHNDPEPLREVHRLLGELKSAWQAIGDQPAAQPVNTALRANAA